MRHAEQASRENIGYRDDRNRLSEGKKYNILAFSRGHMINPLAECACVSLVIQTLGQQKGAKRDRHFINESYHWYSLLSQTLVFFSATCQCEVQIGVQVTAHSFSNYSGPRQTASSCRLCLHQFISSARQEEISQPRSRISPGSSPKERKRRW
jgi:hypothetical protein